MVKRSKLSNDINISALRIKRADVKLDYHLKSIEALEKLIDDKEIENANLEVEKRCDLFLKERYEKYPNDPHYIEIGIYNDKIFPRLFKKSKGNPDYEEVAYEAEKVLIYVRSELKKNKIAYTGKKGNGNLNIQYFIEADIFVYDLLVYELVHFFILSRFIFKGYEDSKEYFVPLCLLGNKLSKNVKLLKHLDLEMQEDTFHTKRINALVALDYFNSYFGMPDKIINDFLHETEIIEKRLYPPTHKNRLSESLFKLDVKPYDYLLASFTYIINQCLDYNQEEAYLIASFFANFYGHKGLEHKTKGDNHRNSFESFKTKISKSKKNIDLNKHFSEKYSKIISKIPLSKRTRSLEKLKTSIQNK